MAPRCNASRPEALAMSSGISPDPALSSQAPHLPASREYLAELRIQLAEPLTHPDITFLHQYGQEVLDWVLRHHKTLADREIGQLASRQEMEALLREPAPEAGTDFSEVLAQLEDRVARFACRPNHPRFLAFIPSAPSFISMLGDWLCSGTNFFA